MVDYWNEITAILNEDDIDYNVVEETDKTPSKKFGIASIERTEKPMEVVVNGVKYSGARILIKIYTTELININSFYLTFGAIDEFLSSTIDEYMYENNLSDINPSMLSRRPFYPYGFFDELLSFYGIKRAPAFEKILFNRSSATCKALGLLRSKAALSYW